MIAIIQILEVKLCPGDPGDEATVGSSESSFMKVIYIYLWQFGNDK